MIVYQELDQDALPTTQHGEFSMRLC